MRTLKSCNEVLFQNDWAQVTITNWVLSVEFKKLTKGISVTRGH